MKTLLLGAVSALALTAAPAFAFEDGKLVIWINGDKGYNGLAQVGEVFAEELGIEVIVEHPESVTDKFQQSAANGQGPDIFIWAHDRFGEWAAGGLIVPVDPSGEIKANTFDFTWDAVTFDGQIWGYPVAVEAVGLIYNKALVPNPPATMEEIAAMKIDGVSTPIMWDYNNTYFTFPLFMAGGGYAFEKVDGSYDPSATGVANDGAVAGASVVKSLIDDGVMPSGVDYGVMDAAINKGETAMVINGPWAWSNLEQSGIDFGVAPIPSVNGQPSKSFVGVLAATVNAASPNKDIAKEFIENYMLTDDGLKTINDDVPLGAVASKSFSEQVADDARIAATLENAKVGVPMPSIPEMGKFWAAMEPALQSITGGQASVEDALKGAEARILAK
ncbi:maltose/maltodextrin ABC transporter substrate-binding protein MalE [Actibacterium sp. 188UL27-1]|uniref:maltose/maltodextrin ABC transporter substrate-binding protein MalE n=1 Tax=Actibacterium sp. 188UL27-1 TaxID=2786961 RepID=UPI00195BE54A|nr:maltose/maltodextrin ABC transporter substrate-binding protein MalE [Actibacterium sp. 188UL27-1]MBM7069160.1 maltose/maltodextrin ABC transporter substrate-binding protein MalE [Actibacterium sp. 188UL27-1]